MVDGGDALDSDGQGRYAGATRLPEGTCEYEFLVDSRWMHDPANPDRVTHDYGWPDSVIRIWSLSAEDALFRSSSAGDPGQIVSAGSGTLYSLNW